MALALRKEEGLGLGIAIAAHAALVAVLLLRPHAAPVVQPPERIEVTISNDIAPQSTSPEPRSQAAADVAPSLGEPQPEEQAPAEALPEAEPEPVPPAPAPPAPAPPKPTPPKPTPAKPKAKPLPPKPVPKPVPPEPKRRPVPPKVEQPTPEPKPRTPERPRETARPTPAKPAPSRRPAARPTAQKSPTRPSTASSASRSKSQGTSKIPPSKSATPSRAPAGGSRIGSDFLAGVTGATSNNRAATASPAATVGPAVKASLASAISRQLKPKWQAPQGPDAEELVTILSFTLNKDGTLASNPTVVRQLGINDMNRNQAQRHAEQAIKAVRLAAPFDLPAEYYDAWKRVSAFRFDKRLSQ